MTSFEHVFYHDQKVHVKINVLSTDGYKRKEAIYLSGMGTLKEM